MLGCILSLCLNLFSSPNSHLNLQSQVHVHIFNKMLIYDPDGFKKKKIKTKQKTQTKQKPMSGILVDCLR